MLILGLCSFKIYSQTIDPKIQEVYADKTQELILNDPERHALLNDLLQNRIKIVESPANPKENYAKLSDITLLNKYNPSLTRDASFDPADFNPLKYNFNFFPKMTTSYRIDNTSYIIMIYPQTLKTN
jgi:hypothetical protein